jgi:hypothetical protein
MILFYKNIFTKLALHAPCAYENMFLYVGRVSNNALDMVPII